jgi:DNA-binding MarR family transcriptional regulator
VSFCSQIVGRYRSDLDVCSFSSVVASHLIVEDTTHSIHSAQVVDRDNHIAPMRNNPRATVLAFPAKDASSYDLDSQIGFRLRLAMQKHTDIFFKNMDLGLTQAQFAAMARLQSAGACSQNQLGRSVGLDTASMVGVIRRLKARKLISIAKNKEDRRRVSIDLTASGRALIAKAMEMGTRANEQTLSPLTLTQRKQLISLLNLLVSTEAEFSRE